MVLNRFSLATLCLLAAGQTLAQTPDDPSVAACKFTGLIALQERAPEITDPVFDIESLAISSADTMMRDVPVKTVILGAAYIVRKEQTGKADRFVCLVGEKGKVLLTDIESLRAAGAVIDGERGFGYRLTEDIALLPQTFTRLEIEALVLGLAEVRHIGEPALAAAAGAVFSKVTATLPDRLQRQALHAASQVYRFERRDPPVADVGLLREACWQERAVVIRYVDAQQQPTDRQVLPLAIVYLERTLVLLAWCCLRQDFRKFRVDWIADIQMTEESFRPRRVQMLTDFVAILNAGAPETSKMILSSH